MGEGKMAKNRTRLEWEAPFAAFVVIPLGAGDVRGQHIWGKLDAPKFGLQVAGEAFDTSETNSRGRRARKPMS
jgi:hypothetical protein